MGKRNTNANFQLLECNNQRGDGWSCGMDNMHLEFNLDFKYNFNDKGKCLPSSKLKIGTKCTAKSKVKPE